MACLPSTEHPQTAIPEGGIDGVGAGVTTATDKSAPRNTVEDKCRARQAKRLEMKNIMRRSTLGGIHSCVVCLISDSVQHELLFDDHS